MSSALNCTPQPQNFEWLSVFHQENLPKIRRGASSPAEYPPRILRGCLFPTRSARPKHLREVLFPIQSPSPHNLEVPFDSHPKSHEAPCALISTQNSEGSLFPSPITHTKFWGTPCSPSICVGFPACSLPVPKSFLVLHPAESHSKRQRATCGLLPTAHPKFRGIPFAPLLVQAASYI